jgi:hypothetical protein
VVSTARIEVSLAVRTLVITAEIRLNCEFGTTDPTENRQFIESIAGPLVGLVVDTPSMTLETGIVVATAREPNRNHISLGVVVGTPGFVVDINTNDKSVTGCHGVASTVRHLVGNMDDRSYHPFSSEQVSRGLVVVVRQSST